MEGTQPLIQALDLCAKYKKNPIIPDCIMDAIQLLGNSSMEYYNLLSRAAIKPYIVNCGQLANTGWPITNDLFDEEVEADLKKTEMS